MRLMSDLLCIAQNVITSINVVTYNVEQRNQEHKVNSKEIILKHIVIIVDGRILCIK